MKIIKIKDYYGNYQEVPVEDALYEEWVKLENEKQRIYRKEVYHRSGVALDDIDAMIADTDTDEMFEALIRKERSARLYDAISQLTPNQQRRVFLFMESMNYAEVARREGATPVPVYRSLQKAFKKLRILMSDYEDCLN